MPRCAAAITSSAVPQLWKAKRRPCRAISAKRRRPSEYPPWQHDVHLDVIDGLREDEVEVALLGGLVLAAGKRDDILLLERKIAGVIVGRQGFLEPADIVVGHVAGDLFDGRETVAAVAHAPPGVGVDHQVEVGPTASRMRRTASRSCSGPSGRAHLVRLEIRVRRRPRLRRHSLRRHIHTRAAVEADAVAHASAEQLRDRDAEAFPDQIVEGDFDAAVDLRQLEVVAGRFEELDAESVGIGERAVRRGTARLVFSMARWTRSLPGPGAYPTRPLSASTRMTMASRLRIVRSPPKKGSRIGSAKG